jgi:hypothetical protein
MMRKNKNSGPCAFKNCEENRKNPENVTFRTITDKAFDKLMMHPNYLNINYLKKNEQLCFTHYMKYVEHKYKHKQLIIKDKSDFSSLNDIKVNITENGVLLSEEDFSLMVQKIENLEEKIGEKTREIENILDTNNVFLTVRDNSEKCINDYLIDYLIDCLIDLLFN